MMENLDYRAQYVYLDDKDRDDKHPCFGCIVDEDMMDCVGCKMVDIKDKM
jgi:hypothetical protein